MCADMLWVSRVLSSVLLNSMLAHMEDGLLKQY